MNKVKIFTHYHYGHELQEAINDFIANGRYSSRELINVSFSTSRAGYETHYHAAVVYSEKENS